MKNKVYGYIDPEHLKPELSTKLYRTTYSYIKQFYTEKIFEETCEELGMPKAYLLDDDNWVSVSFGRKFAQLIKSKTADAEVYRKIGHYFFDANNMNPIESQVLKSISPLGFFKTLPALYMHANQACNMTIHMHSFGDYEIKIEAKSGTVYSDMMLNTLGVFEGLKDFYSLKNFNISLLQSIEKSSEVKTFLLRVNFSFALYVWTRFSFILSLVFYGSVFGFVLHELESRFGLKVFPIFIGLNFLTGFFCVSFWRKLNVMKNNINLNIERSRDKNYQLYQKTNLLDRRYKEANLLKQLSSQLIEVKDPQDIVDKLLNSIKGTFNYSQSAIFLVSDERKKLFLSQSRGFEALSEKIGNIEFDYPADKIKDGFFAYVLESGNTALIYDIDEYKKIIRPENKQILDFLKVGSMIVCPIQTKNKKYGVLSIFRQEGEQPLESQDKFLIENICRLFALYLENAANYQKEVNLRSIFQKYVPRPVLEQLTTTANRGDGSMKPTRTNICSFFADLRNFTTISETLTPEKVFEMINEYSRFLTSHLSEQGVIIDNIIGDAVVAFSVDNEQNSHDHKVRVLKAILNIVDSWGALATKMSQMGVKDAHFGIGIHSGEATVGSVGSEFRMNYTALGDTVNTASRIQSLTKRENSHIASTGISIAISAEFFHNFIEGIPFETHRLRGKVEETQVAFLNHDLIFLLRQKIATYSERKTA